MQRDNRFKRSRSRKFQRQNPRFKDKKSPRRDRDRDRDPRRRLVSEERILLEETRKYERRMGADKQPIQLHVAENFEELSSVVASKTSNVSGLKRLDRLPSLGEKMFSDLLQTLNDQEVAYIIGARYLKLMDHVFKFYSDKTFIELRYGSEYRKVKAIMTELETELKVRYEEKTRGQERARRLREQDASELAASTSTAVQPPEKPAGVGDVAQQEPIFERMDISSVDLYGALMKKMNVLIVDMRSNEDFKESHIIVEEGHLANIPEDIVVPGLSANTLGQRLSEETQKIWNQRDNFDVIILLDWETDSFNFSGSKLERLRNCIVEWDFNRKYVQQPVVLSGGYKEFLECYPTEVTNSHAFLSQTNSEIDDLLTIDDVSYPDPGSGNLNLKARTISSFVNIEARVERDFGDLEVTPGPAARPSRSEGQLPKDFYSSKEGVSPYRSLSQESLPKDYFAVDTMVEPLTPAIIEPGLLEDQDVEEPLPFVYEPLKDEVPEEVGDEKVGKELKISDDEEAAQIKSAIEGEKAELLSRVRALKPKSPRENSQPVAIKKDPFVRPAQPPKVDRTFKPARVQQIPKEGYTGMKNVRNNCYVSCMMQCLKVLPFFKSMFATSDTYIHHIHKHPPVVTLHFAAVMKALWEGTPRKPKSYYPQVFLDKVYHLNPVYAKGNHEDTFEFFILLFNNLSEDCSLDMPRPKIMTEREKSWYSQLQGRTSYFVDLFYYQLKNTKICWHCQKPNYVFDSDSTLMVSISENKEENTLEFLLKDYLKENLIEDYSCADCKHAATIVNRKEIVLDPEILIIILKRYSATSYGSIKKNEAEISFPADKLVFGNSYYKLYAIPQHSGSMSVGHYFASVLLNDTTNTWVIFNDERVSRYTVPITEVPRIKSSCVGFFYVRQKSMSKL